MRTALVHDWLLSPVGGSENILREMYSLYPAPIHTLIFDPTAFSNTELSSADIHTSFIKSLPWGKSKFRAYLPLFPLAVEQFDLKNYDLILSSSHCVAKGVLTHPDQLHICYCHTPMRYAWDLSFDYLREFGMEKGIKGAIARLILHYMRGWDVISSHRVDHFVANSQFIAKRIRRAYGREADVIYCGVDTDFFCPKGKKEEYYLAASRLVPYKKIDVIVEAFSKMPDRKLVVIGDGPEMGKIRKIAGSNIELMGYQPNSVLLETMQKAKAFLFAAIEDFGLLPVEAIATGTPVIGLRRGGLAEVSTESETGIFFEEQNALSIIEAVQRFERIDSWDIQRIRNRALYFSKERFREEFKRYVEEKKRTYEHSDSCRRRRHATLASIPH